MLRTKPSVKCMYSSMVWSVDDFNKSINRKTMWASMALDKQRVSRVSPHVYYMVRRIV